MVTITQNRNHRQVSNTIDTSNLESFIGAGGGNTITGVGRAGVIVGGEYNLIQDKTGTRSSSMFASILGGDHLIAQSYGQTVLGYYNTARGNSVYNSTINGNDPSLIIGNGTSTTRSNGFEVRNRGYSVVSSVNGTGATTPATTGGTYADNVIYAWGRGTDPGANGNFNLDANFGIASGQANRIAAGKYQITMTIVTPDGTAHNLSDAAITVTPINVNNAPLQLSASVSTLGVANNQFTIYLTNNVNALAAGSFMFIVTGRP